MAQRGNGTGMFDARHYPKYDEVVNLLEGWEDDYPHLANAYSIGRSYEGRDIWLCSSTLRGLS